MIRINLLPVRAAKKKESARFQLTVSGLIILLVVVILIGAFIKFSTDAYSLKNDIASAEKELAELEIKVGELTKLKDEKKVVEGKLDVVRQLEKARSGPVDLFAKIADAIPEKAWLISIQDSGVVIEIKGNAINDEVLAEFMRRLDVYRELGGVELVVAKRVKSPVPGGAEFVEFSLNLDKSIGKR